MFADAPLPRTFAALSLPLSLVWYLIPGHAPIYGWLLWFHELSALLNREKD